MWFALPSAHAGHAHTFVAPSLPRVIHKQGERDVWGNYEGGEDDGDKKFNMMGLCKEIEH
jgi:hypothetical protein